VTTCQGPGPFLIFGVGYLVWHLSKYLVLEPGDLIVTGTPEGGAISGASRIWRRAT
jgi:2-keto-4-pentenoate hydratase/2-oxohepta-3-ene-1,7-dioic acid hydratase in catechol pathway